MLTWMGVDYTTWKILQGGSTVEGRGPGFVAGWKKRGAREWFLGWVGREGLAFWVWLWAFFGGVEVVWRGRKFWVGVDMRVHEIGSDRSPVGNGMGERKARVD